MPTAIQPLAATVRNRESLWMRPCVPIRHGIVGCSEMPTMRDSAKRRNPPAVLLDRWLRRAPFARVLRKGELHAVTNGHAASVHRREIQFPRT